MATAPGFCHVILTLKHALVLRPAAVTWACDPTSTDPVQTAADMFTAFTTSASLRSLIDSNVTCGPTTVFMGTDGAEDIVGVHNVTLPGLRSGASIAPNQALLFTKRTSRGGRRGKGRLFLPWSLNQSDMDEAGIIPPANITTANTAGAAFLTALTGFNAPMVVLHKASTPDTDHPTTPGAPNNVTSLAASNLISTQRRRLGR